MSSKSEKVKVSAKKTPKNSKDEITEDKNPVDNICKYCDKKLSSKYTLKNHENTCKNKPSDINIKINNNCKREDDSPIIEDDNGENSDADYESHSDNEEDNMCNLKKDIMPPEKDDIDLTKNFVIINGSKYNINEIIGNVDMYNLKDKDLNDPKNFPNTDILERHYNSWLTKKTCQYIDTLMKVEFSKMQTQREQVGGDFPYNLFTGKYNSEAPEYADLCAVFNCWMTKKIKGYVQELLRIEKYKKDKQEEYKSQNKKIPLKYRTDPDLDIELKEAYKKIKVRNEFLLYFFNKNIYEKKQQIIDYLINNGIDPNDIINVYSEAGIITPATTEENTENTNTVIE
jgi:hypothetical protein